jgi:hypothetical protein
MADVIESTRQVNLRSILTLVAQVVAYAALWLQLASHGVQFIAQTEHLKSIDRQLGRVDRVETGLHDLRSDIAQLRSEFVEFRAETRAEFKALHVELAGMRTDLAEIKTLLEARR